MSDNLLLVRDEGPARILTLNRVEKRNALNIPLMQALSVAFENIAGDATIRTVILHGAGPGFSSGIDFFSLTGIDMTDGAAFRHLVHQLQDITNKISRLEKPVICVLHGFCVGMALEIALACDVRLAEAGCKINIEEVRLGLIPDVGGCTRLVRTVGLPRAKELIMTGKSIPAETAAQWGLINEVLPEKEGLPAALKWHGEFLQGAPRAVGLSKFVLDRAFDLDRALSMDLEALAQTSLVTTEDFREGVASRIEKRAPQWKGR